MHTANLTLVGHSTGGLDIRQLVCYLHDPKKRRIPVDGGLTVDADKIRNCLDGVVFLSVPHWGTNVADWLYTHPILRKTAIADLRAAFAGSQIYLLDQIEAGIADSAATLTGAELLLALSDALTEANDYLSGARSDADRRCAGDRIRPRIVFSRDGYRLSGDQRSHL